MNTELLKKKILQLAMQGKLVEQDENDGTADELIDKIIEEKKQLMAEGKIKKEKLSRIYKNPTDNHYYEKFEDGGEKDITDEILYEIPTNWSWSRLRNIGIYKKGPFGSSLTKSIFVPKGKDTIKVYEQKNAINKDSKLGDYYITNKYFKENMTGFEVEPGDIIVSCAGTIGETYILPDKIEKGIINQALMKMRIVNRINVKFFLSYFDQTLKQEAVKNGKGTAMKNIPPFSIFKEYLIPIPPIEEQNRIVTKVYELFKKVNLIKEHYDKINKLKKFLKSKIIDMAIKGELTKQLDTDESASKLIENVLEEKRKLIMEGKIKKENLSVIYKDSTDNQFYEKFDNGKIVNITDKIPFDIPKEWLWSRLRNIGIYKKGPFGSSLTKSIFVPKGEDTLKVYEQKNAINKDDKLGNYYISKEYFESNMTGFEVESGDIIVSCAGTIGETYILPDKIEKGIINQALMKMKIFYPINIEFFLMYFDQILKKEANKNGKGTAMKNIPPFTIFKEYLIPIPPLEEQNRIIKQKYNIINYIETAE